MTLRTAGLIFDSQTEHTNHHWMNYYDFVNQPRNGVAEECIVSEWLVWVRLGLNRPCKYAGQPKLGERQEDFRSIGSSIPNPLITTRRIRCAGNLTEKCTWELDRTVLGRFWYSLWLDDLLESTVIEDTCRIESIVRRIRNYPSETSNWFATDWELDFEPNESPLVESLVQDTRPNTNRLRRVRKEAGDFEATLAEVSLIYRFSMNSFESEHWVVDSVKWWDPCINLVWLREELLSAKSISPESLLQGNPP